jgi:hypothetical protein
MPAIKLPVPRRLLAVLFATVLAIAAGSSLTTSTATATYCERCENFTFSSLNPPIGTSFVEGEPHPLWTMNADPGFSFVVVRVSTSPETGTDGHTLSDLQEVHVGAPFYFNESETNRGFFRTNTEEPSRYLPQGTYYWQMEGLKEVLGYQTPIYSFVVTPKPELVQPTPTPTHTPQPSPTPAFSNSPTSPETEHQTTPHCRTAHIGGKTRCLRSGQSCVWQYRKQYRRYHYACVRKGSKFRLVRVAH